MDSGLPAKLRAACGGATLKASKLFKQAADEIERLDTALAQQAAAKPERDRIARAIHYPQCWDTAAFPTLESALIEHTEWYGCDECKVREKAAAKAAASIGDDEHFQALLCDVLVAAKKFVTIKEQAATLDALIAHIDSNRAAPAAGEPVGYMRLLENGTKMGISFDKLNEPLIEGWKQVPVFLAAPAAGELPQPHTIVSRRAFSADQMRDYASAAVQAAAKDIESIADELEQEASNYEGDFADTVKGCVDALRNFATPTTEQAERDARDGALEKFRHTGGVIYEKLGELKAKVGESGWWDAVRYRCTDTGKEYVTDIERWRASFTPIAIDRAAQASTTEGGDRKRVVIVGSSTVAGAAPAEKGGAE